MKYLKTYENLGFGVSKPLSKSIKFGDIEFSLMPAKESGWATKRLVVLPVNDKDTEESDHSRFVKNWKNDVLRDLSKEFDKRNIKYVFQNDTIYILDDVINVINTYYKTFYEE